MRVQIESETVPSARFGAVPQLNAVATADDEGVSVFLVNRSTTDAATATIDLGLLTSVLGRDVAVTESHLLHDDDISAANTLERPERVGVRALDDVRVVDSALLLTLPPVSWAAVRLA